jgi:Icc-related predicted phosphoesterase
MTILVIADDEGVATTAPDAMFDVLVSCGDLPDEVILKVAQRVRCAHILAVKGNHDSSGTFDPRITDLHLKTVNIRGLTFGGFCGSWKYKPMGNYLFEQSEVYSALESFPRVDLFVAHNSPSGIHDSDDEVHLGFSAFMTYIMDLQPKFFLHGHQHKNAETTINCTKVIGVYGHRNLIIEDSRAKRIVGDDRVNPTPQR